VRCAGLLVLSPVALPQAPPADLVRSLFDLTAGEVARDLTTARTVEDIAAGAGVSINTVRSQVRAVLKRPAAGGRPTRWPFSAASPPRTDDREAWPRG
jgi:DNA-binding CsgD family transcriptional regulator